MKFKYQPQTREELIQIIKDETQRQLDEAYEKYNEFEDDDEDDDSFDDAYELYEEEGLVTIDLNFIDVSKITDMSYVFHEAISWENEDLNIELDDFQGFYLLIDRWDVSNVTDMEGMFMEVEFRADLYDWNVSNVKNMSMMFDQCGVFDSNLSSWNTSNVENMSGMFDEENYLFDADTIRKWDVSGLKDKKDYERILELLSER